jgi:hypothetical protein
MMAPLLIAIVFASQPPTPSPPIRSQPPQQQSKTQTNQTNNPKPAIIQPSVQQPTNQPQQSPTPQNQQPSSNWRDWFTGDRANWAIVLLTFVLAVIGYFQWSATHAGNKHTVVVERAYISVPSVALLNFSPDRLLGLEVQFVNSGHLPAQFVSYTATLYTEEVPPETPEYSEWGPASGLVAPNGTVKTQSLAFIGEPRMSRAQYDSAVWGEFQLHIVGAVKYTDGFGEVRETGFGFFYNNTLSDKTINQRFSFSPNQRYNYMK